MTKEHLLHKLILDNIIFFKFLDNIEKNHKKLSKVLNAFVDIMQNIAQEQMLYFHNIFKNLVFQRHYYGVKGKSVDQDCRN